MALNLAAAFSVSKQLLCISQSFAPEAFHTSERNHSSDDALGTLLFSALEPWRAFRPAALMLLILQKGDASMQMGHVYIHPQPTGRKSLWKEKSSSEVVRSSEKAG